MNDVLDTAPGTPPPGPLSVPVSARVATPLDCTRKPASVSVCSGLFVGLFAVFLASFPARNLDVWKHLADARDLVRGVDGLSPTWLYDITSYALYSIGDGFLLVGVKAILVGAAAILLLRISSRTGGWRIPLVVTGLTVLAMASRLLLQPATVSVLFLVLTLWILLREDSRSPRGDSLWPGWQLVVLFAVWANIDGRFVLGLGLVGLFWLGQAIDARPPGGFGRALGRWAVAVGILVGASCLSPSHVNALRPPAELRAAVVALREGSAGDGSVVNSPFNPAYLDIFRDSPAALAFYPLLALSLLSFALNRKEWRWAWFLPWVFLAVLSGIQVRLAPFFAVVAGPVAAWNLHGFFARRASPAPVRTRVRVAVMCFTVVLASAFLVSAWPGWLQGPPFEPRRWAVEIPEALPRGAEFLERANASGLWAADTRTLHASADAASAFAWFYSQDHAVRDEAIVSHLLDPDDAGLARDRLRLLGVSRVVVYAGDPSIASRSMLDRLLADPDEWPVLHLTGGLVVFGWRDPARSETTDPFANREVDFARLAFRPDDLETAPHGPPPAKRRWWDAFWKAAPPPRPLGRDEATVLLRKAAALARSAPVRHQAAWEVVQMTGLIGAAGGWMGPACAADLPLRLALLHPPIPDNAPLPAITRLTFAIQQQFAAGRGPARVGVLYAAIRAARRSVWENPNDANSYLALGRAYGALGTTISEQDWTMRLPQLMRLRQVQASAALNRAVTLNPKLAEAHLELGRLYLSLECLDLAAVHFQAYRDSAVHRGGPPKGSPQAEAVGSELERLTTTLERQTREFTRESERSSVIDRAYQAVRRGLGGEARDLLLKSHLAAFGSAGMELELDLLLRTGRPEEVLEWMTPDVQGSLGDSSYHWLRAQALVAVGEYDAADAAMSELVSPTGRLPAAPLLAREIGRLVGKAVLDESVGAKTPPHAVVLAINRSNYRNQIDDMTIAARRSAEITVLRGLIALEGGFIHRARDAFQHGLSLSLERGGSGQLEFNGRPVARECLSLIDGAAPSRPDAP